jgi:5-formyltetrahydrofolate cyclo-ligase
VREWRDEVLPEDEHHQKSHELCEILLQENMIGEDELLLGFAPIRKEVDLLPLYRQLSESVRMALPRVERSTLGLYGVEDRSRLVRSLEDDQPAEGFNRGEHEIIEPDPERSTEVVPSQLDSILVPGLVFDREGRRIGYGSGYYDRLLSTVPDRTGRIGVCFEEQVVRNELPEEPHDERVDHVVTEEGIQ